MNRRTAYGSAFFILLLSALHCRHFANRNPVGRAEPVFSGSRFTETGTERKMESGADSLGPFDVTVHSFKDVEGRYAVSLQKQTWRESNISVYSWIQGTAPVVNAEDYLGLSIHDLPAYEIGICSYITDRSQFAYPLVVDIPNAADVEQAVFFLWKTADGRFAAAVPLGGDGFRNVLRIQHGKLEAIGRSYVDAAKPGKVPLLAVGTSGDPYSLIFDIMRFSVHAMGLHGGLRAAKTFPVLFEKFGWCTWNALGRYGGSLGEKITAEDLYAAAKSFRKGPFAMPWMLIDDGWQMAANRKMTGFDAVKSKFPEGLSGTVQILKRQYGVPHVGVWHAIAGYWDGIHPNSPMARRYQDAWMSNRSFLFPTAASAKGAKWYADWYDHLKASGIDFLKVDNQGAILNLIRGAAPVWDGAEQMEANMQGEIRRVFDGAVINCMAMKPEVYYHWTQSAVARSSYDYLSFGKTGPKGPFEVFIRTNFQNSLWFSELVWPDFDMFQSHLPHSMADALARVMSGGPIYCTDMAGKQNWGVLSSVQLSDGTVLRPDAPGRPTLDCLFQADEAKPYKVFSICGKTALLAVWNLSNRDTATGTVSPADVHGLKGKTFAVYEHFSGRLDVMKRNESLTVRLGKYETRLFLIRPVRSDIEPLGLLDKLVSPAALAGESRERNQIQIELAEGGVFGAYAKKEPRRVIVQDRVLSGGEFSFQNHLLKLRIDSRQNVLLKIVN